MLGGFIVNTDGLFGVAGGSSATCSFDKLTYTLINHSALLYRRPGATSYGLQNQCRHSLVIRFCCLQGQCSKLRFEKPMHRHCRWSKLTGPVQRAMFWQISVRIPSLISKSVSRNGHVWQVSFALPERQQARYWQTHVRTLTVLINQSVMAKPKLDIFHSPLLDRLEGPVQQARCRQTHVDTFTSQSVI